MGFEADNIPLMIEAIPVSADSIILIISKVEDPEELDTRFSQIHSFRRFPAAVLKEPALNWKGPMISWIFSVRFMKPNPELWKSRKKKRSQEVPSADQAVQPSISVNLMRGIYFPDTGRSDRCSPRVKQLFSPVKALCTKILKTVPTL